MVHAGVYAQAPCNANPVTNQIVCNNSATTAINFTGTATTFNWVNNTPSIGLAASGTGNIAAFTAINATATTIIATITVTPSSGACTGTPISFSITVNPSPVVSVTPTVACGGIAGIYGVPLSASSGPVVPGSVTVSSGILNVTVPDNNASGLISPLAMAGVPANATITNVAVTLNMSHTYPGDMIFNLKAPNGQILNLYKYGTGQFTGATSGNATWGWSGAKVSQTGTTAWSTVAAAPYIYNNSTAWRADGINGAVSGVTIQNPTGFASNASLFSNLYSTAASTTGNWTLAMCDGGAGDIGTFVEWSLTIDYTTPGTVPTYTYLWSALPGLFTDPTATAAYSGTNTPVVYAAPGVSTTYTVTATNTATGCTNTATALVNSTPPAPVITPPSVNMCLGDAPVKLKVVTGFPANPAVWSPASGLFRDATAAIPYVAGTAVDSVWVRPTPAGVYTYQVTRSGIPPGTPPCTSPPRLVVVTVSAPVTIITQPVNKTVCNNSSATFTVGVTGTGPFTYQWQMSINGGATYNNIANVAPFSGTATAALTINPASLGMNGNLFRLLVNGGACPGSTSSAALLTVYKKTLSR